MNSSLFFFRKAAIKSFRQPVTLSARHRSSFGFSSSNNAMTNDVKLKKNPIRFFMAFLGLNGLLALAYLKKKQNENRFALPVQQKLKEFTQAFNANPTQFSQEDIQKLFDEFLVENVAITLSEKVTEEIRAITQTLCEKYPKSREIQFFASEVSQYERRAIYLKAALVADRKYIDEVLVRQMELNCSRFGEDKPFFFDEFFNTCTKFSLQNKQDEANMCLSSYLSLNPPNYYRAAIQRIKNDIETGHHARLLNQVQDLFEREQQQKLSQKDKDYVLSFVSALPIENDLQDKTQQIKAANLLAHGSNPQLALRFVKSVLKQDSKNAEALAIEANIAQKLAAQQNAIDVPVAK